MTTKPSNEKSVAEARRFAVAAHGAQKYGSEPYVFHLDAVAALLEPFGAEAQIAGYLHDVVEDTAVGLDRVRAEFGEHISECVGLVSDSAEGDREAKKVRANAKLAKVEGRAQLALIVKAADRLANLRMCTRAGSEAKLEKYRREHPAFRAAAYRAGLCDELWTEIDRIISLGRSA